MDAEVKEGVDCIMPAAGRSLRMGSWKLLLPFGGSTVAQRSVANALGVCERLILVTGHRAGELEHLFRADERVRIVHNPRFDSGMYSSIRRGVAEVQTERFFVALADMPLIAPEVYRDLIAFAAVQPRPSVVRPVYHGIRGHPVLFPPGAASLFASIDGERGMADLLERLPMAEMVTEDLRVVCDIDTPDDYERACAMAR